MMNGAGTRVEPRMNNRPWQILYLPGIFYVKEEMLMNFLETVCDTITGVKDSVVNYFEDTTTTRKKLFAIGAVCTLIGILAGFMFAPIKKGVYINISNNGSNNGMPPVDEDDED